MKFIIVFAAVLAVAVAAPQPGLLDGLGGLLGGIGDLLGAVVGTVLATVSGVLVETNGVISAVTTLVVGAVVTIAGAACCTIVSVSGAVGCLVGNVTYTLASISAGGRCTMEIAGCRALITTTSMINGCNTLILDTLGHLVGALAQAIICLQAAITTCLAAFVITQTDLHIWRNCICIWSSCVHQFLVLSNSLDDAYALAGGKGSCDASAEYNFQAHLVQSGSSYSLKIESINDMSCVIKQCHTTLLQMLNGLMAKVGQVDCSAFYVQQ